MAQLHASTDMESLSDTDAMVELLPSSDQHLFTRRVLSKTAVALAILLGLALVFAPISFNLARTPASSEGSDYVGLAADEWAGVLSDDAMKQMKQVSAEQESGITDDTTAAPAASEVEPAIQAPPATEAPSSTTRAPPTLEVPKTTEAAKMETTNSPQTTKAAAPEMDPLMTEAANSQTVSKGATSSATSATVAAAGGAAAAGTAATAAGAAAAAGASPETVAETMMVGQAGKVANAVAQKAENTLEAKLNEKPPKCTGPNCCLGSTCMGLPGMSCHANRGTTTCVGSNAFSFTEGMCRCVSGPCNVGGFCPDAPKIAGKSPGGGTVPSASSAAATTPATLAKGSSASAPKAVSTPWSR